MYIGAQGAPVRIPAIPPRRVASPAPAAARPPPDPAGPATTIPVSRCCGTCLPAAGCAPAPQPATRPTIERAARPEIRRATGAQETSAAGRRCQKAEGVSPSDGGWRAYVRSCSRKYLAGFSPRRDALSSDGLSSEERPLRVAVLPQRPAEATPMASGRAHQPHAPRSTSHISAAAAALHAIGPVGRREN